MRSNLFAKPCAMTDFDALQTDNPNAVKLSQALSVQAEAERATVNLSLTAADVMAMAKTKPVEK